MFFYRRKQRHIGSENVVEIRFGSCDEVRAFMEGLNGLVAGSQQSGDLSELLPVEYDAPVKSLVFGLRDRQPRENVVKVEEDCRGLLSIQWTATKDAFADALMFLEPLAKSSGGHQYLTSAADGAEIVALHYK